MDGSRGGYGKRSLSQYGSESTERNGRQKRRNEAGFDGSFEPSSNLSDNTVYRLLCPNSKIGSVIGKGGSIIKSLRQETGAKIKIDDGIPGVDERVITISTARKDRDKGSERKSRGDEENGEEMATFVDLDGDLSDETLPPALDALLKVLASIVEGDISFSDDEEEGPRNVTIRLLVPHSQAGCLLGKGGKVIEQMRTETAAQIRILPKDQLPGCALTTDELVQILGDWNVVKKALFAVGNKLYENPPKDQSHRGITLAANRLAGGGGRRPAGAFLPEDNSYSSSRSVRGSLIGHVPSVPPLGNISAGRAGSWQYDSQDFHVLPSLGPHGSQKDVPEEEFVIRMLCSDDKIGSIIGRGGNLIRQLRDETRAKIKIEDAVSDSDERVITVSSKEAADSTVSPTLDAVLHLQHRIADLTSEKDGDSTTTKLLVPSSAIGCLLGRGGNVITEIRKTTRANIRITSKDSLPKSALESDGLVQIMGDHNVARDALVQIVTKLRNNLFREHNGNSDMIKGIEVKPLAEVGYQLSMPSIFECRQEARSPENFNLYSGLGVQEGARSSYANSSGMWAYQGGDNDRFEGLSPYGGVASKSSALFARSGKPSGGLSAIVSNTTLEIRIPSSAVGSVIGKGGSNIAHIREKSRAKVKLHDGKPGATERTVEISGTPEQTQAAQSLLDTFLLSAQSQGSLGLEELY